MNKSLLFFALSFFGLNSLDVCSQDFKLRTHSLQVEFGVASTYYWKSPVSTPCFECKIETQKAGLGQNYSISYFRKFKKNKSAKLGVGYAHYRFTEEGTTFEGNDSFPYVLKAISEYINIKVGNLVLLGSNTSVSSFMENEIIIEVYNGDNEIFRPVAVSAQLQGGALFPITDVLNLKLMGSLRTGIMNFATRESGLSYVPKSLGLQIGFFIQF